MGDISVSLEVGRNDNGKLKISAQCDEKYSKETGSTKCSVALLIHSQRVIYVVDD